MSYCRICGTSIRPFMSFGEKMPIANGFLTPDQFADEYFFNLAPAVCGTCGMVQLIDQPNPERMFHENYAFFSSTSRYMQVHFKNFADSVYKTYFSDSTDDPFVVELGSNDGIMLGNFAARKIRHLGIEPSSNVADVARGKGINTISEFFGEPLARRILEEQGPADAILAANVMCHIPNLNEVAAGVRILLKPDGVLVFEDPYLGDMVEKTSYDQIYDEHVFIFSASSVSQAFGRHGLELINAEPQITHGGSMRYTIAAKGSRPVAPAVAETLKRESALGLGSAETFEKFRANCEGSRERLMNTLEDTRAKGMTVVGYGATSKSTTVITYCGITDAHLAYIADTTPVKQGKFSPGAHIPIKPYEDFVASYPDQAVLFAWNHMKEIMEKEDGFKNAGGRWIHFVPYGR